MQTLREQFRRELSGPSLPLVAFCVALNLLVGQITGLLKVPIYLDSIGTVLAAVLTGPWAAVVCGCLSNIMAAAFGNPTMMFFIPPMVSIGLFAGFIARLGWFRKLYLCFVGGILQGIIASLLSAPISAQLFSGTTMGGADFLVIFFRSRGFSIFESTLLQGLMMDPVDKILTFTAVFFLTRNLPERLVTRFPGASNIQSRKG